jgi:hypothetical protein
MLLREIDLLRRSADRLQKWYDLLKASPEDPGLLLRLHVEARQALFVSWKVWTEVTSKEKREAAGNDRKYVLATLGDGPRYNLTDTDMQLIQDALAHSINDGHIKENKERAQGLVAEVETLRTDQG